MKHLKTGSAYYAPSAGAVQMAEAIVNDQRAHPAVRRLARGRVRDEGPVPRRARASSAANGLEKVIEVELTSDERAALEKSAEAVREPMRAVKL